MTGYPVSARSLSRDLVAIAYRSTSPMTTLRTSREEASSR
ncbi:hypothetical protein EV644_103385 [Kribbella orskensis]|uniref:Uncharacterized protein n=1 Tax=Kribbella orskensis TaxID=2512216 RepID=A0ABY2BPX5_9ACTN|nr:hypothetical protein EV644_103385 [Kribbella orskensis]